ncbi:hypothetical protein ZIOFF_065005 [Zingiber officinale]|uniref:Uncharacterized protein n=1 Tax=Zingiber officinale TaxID=94328 RepID=A0A8J5EY48_ZINOF|nr:hypothetical protein ZIOFF_065005 [Zingiber officinale]
MATPTRSSPNWLKNIETQLRLLEIPKVFKVDVVTPFLEDKTCKWWEIVAPAMTEVGPVTWQQFKEMFLKQYYPIEFSLFLASPFAMSRPMSHPTRDSVIAALLLLLLLFVSCSHGSSDRRGLRVSSIAKKNPGYLTGFLPRGVPIPPSGPSKKHNSIGLQNKATP